MSQDAVRLDQAITLGRTSSLGARLLRGVVHTPAAALVSGFLLCTFFAVAIFAPALAPHDPRNQELTRSRLPPVFAGAASTWEHPLGTDQLGRDELSRVIWGARSTALVVMLALGGAIVIGTAAGIFAGYLGGLADNVVMRLVDIQLSVPSLILAIALASVLKPGFQNILIVLVVWSWAPFARVIRSEVLAQRGRDYILQARVVGCTPLRIMARHLLPNIANTILVLATLDVGRFVVFEAGLSFLGLGVQEPNPAWGSMLAAGRIFVVDAWWLAVIPGVAILLISLAGNLLGDYLTDQLDPRQRGRRRMTQ
jgi:peptide/nickel transport system permease protein